MKLSLLKSQHRAAAKIFGELEKGRAANAEARVRKLVASLSAHMVIEQELFYPAIAEAILETGFKGYFAHEFIPKRTPLASLEEATTLCDL